MLVVLRHGHVFAPEDLGVQDILVAGGKIVAMGKNLEVVLPGLEEVDLEGAVVIPGLVDQHVHVTGGGGEAGFPSRVPPLAFSDCAKAGVTTLVGTLGTDSHTRTLRDLIAKVGELEQNGITAYCLTGAYEYPSPTLTGNVSDDIVFIKPVIGCKLAISDHRCSYPTTEEIIRLVGQVRLAGLESGKVGELHIHVGADPRGIEQLFEIHEKTIIPVTQFRPTHMGGHVEQAIRWCGIGGYSDITSSSTVANAALKLYEKLGKTCWDHVTMSSDSNGSFPKWNEKREIIGMDRGRMTTLLEGMEAMVKGGMRFTDAISLSTSHPADALHFTEAGHVKVGCRADLCILDGFKPVSVMAKGNWLLKDGQVVKTGMFGE